MEKAEIEEQIRLVDGRILEVKERMPAHSVKPAIMNELFELEDEREGLIKKLEELAVQ